MERRDFFKKTLACGGGAGIGLGTSSLMRASQTTKGPGPDPLVERVRIAMPTMQGQAWEQGVASHALLEWGDADLVIMMAKEAVIRIYDDGRLGQVCDNHGVTDPGSNGEPVLYAAKLTGDPVLKAAAGMTRVLGALPEGLTAEKRKLQGYIKDVIDGCLGYLRPDGYFHDGVDDPKSFVETNLSQIMAYSIYRGIKGGWIDVFYRPRADKMREAAHRDLNK